MEYKSNGLLLLYTRNRFDGLLEILFVFRQPVDTNRSFLIRCFVTYNQSRDVDFAADPTKMSCSLRLISSLTSILLQGLSN